MLPPKSRAKLADVHPELCRVVERAAELCDFIVVEGSRTLAKQREYFQAGKSKTMNSRHLLKPAAGLKEYVSHAVDLAPLVDLDGDGDKELSWELDHFLPIRAAMETAAAKEGVKIVWGGSWKSFVDAPHWELDRTMYP